MMSTRAVLNITQMEHQNDSNCFKDTQRQQKAKHKNLRHETAENKLQRNNKTHTKNYT